MKRAVLWLLSTLFVTAAVFVSLMILGVRPVPIEPDPTEGQTLSPNPRFPPYPIEDPSPIPAGQDPGNAPVEVIIPPAVPNSVVSGLSPDS
jgi:hypothetical protein